jgi:dihydropteroate synthase
MNAVAVDPIWQVSTARNLPLDRPRLMGILNVTPDSFSDGGLHVGVHAAVGHALRMEGEGAEIIDIGGESTRPGAAAVPAHEQIARAIPVIEQVRRGSEVLISIDTTSAEVARAALDAGADVINDTSAGQDDPAMFALAAERRCGLVLMHRPRRPREESWSDRHDSDPVYDDVVREVRAFLLQRAHAAEQAGIERACVVTDPGLGFGKNVEQNYQLVARTAELVATGYPVLAAASRKSFIGAATGQRNPRQRVIGSVAVSVAQYLAGIRLFRVHDVAAHREALAVAAMVIATP